MVGTYLNEKLTPTNLLGEEETQKEVHRLLKRAEKEPGLRILRDKRKKLGF